MDITVLICTRNRAQRLRDVLASATRIQVAPSLKWELIVVDNGSSDATAQVALEFSDRLPIRLVAEETPGLSHARNRGVAEARGRYICWTDDDVLIDPEWLAAYAAAFERHPDAVVFGGRIIPVLEAPSPNWFARLADRWPLTTLLAKRDFGSIPIRLDLHSDVVPWGANFAVRADEQRRVRYHPELGVSPRQHRLGEEAEVIHQIMNAGGIGWWVPEAQVQHITPTQRQTLHYVYDYFLSYGETVAYLERTWPGAHHMTANKHEVDRSRGSPTRLYSLAILSSALFGVAWLTGASHRGLKFLVRAGFYTGAARISAAGATRRAARVDRPAKRIQPRPI